MDKLQVMSLPAAAKLLGIHPQTLRRMVHEGKIPYIQFDKYYRFRYSELLIGLNHRSGISEPPDRQG